MMLPTIPPIVPLGAKFEFGQSPFRVKGVLYAGTQSYFDSVMENGFQKLLDTVGPGPVADFISQKFLASSYYDAMPIPVLIAYEAMTQGLSLERYLFQRTQYQARRDMRGVYRFLLKLVSPEAVMERLPRIFTQMFDFGDIEIKEPGPQERDVRLYGIPRALNEYYTTVLKTYAELVLEMAGANQPKVAVLRPSMGETKHGIVLQTMHLRFMWS